MAKSGHVDPFARDNLPPRALWPEFKFDLPELQYPERLNCVTEWVGPPFDWTPSWVPGFICGGMFRALSTAP